MLYFGNRAVVKELTREIRDQAFQAEPAAVVGTGGFSRLFEHEVRTTAVARQNELNASIAVEAISTR